MKPHAHEWRFFRAGGFDQVRIETGADLRALAQLDQKLWVALSCPTRGIEFDAHTLALLDTDRDGHIRAPEILAAVAWAAARLTDINLLAKGSNTLPLSAIDDSDETGRQLLAAARQVLNSLGKPAADSVCAADTADIAALLAKLRFNGDGVIAADTCDDPALQAAIADIMRCCGSVTDCGGQPGIGLMQIEAFFKQAADYADWQRRSITEPALLPLGDASDAAGAIWQSVRAKVDDYFTRCRMAAYDPRAALPLSRSVEDYQALAGQSLNAATAGLAEFPLAQIAAGRALPLGSGINPAWSQSISQLRQHVIVPLLGERDSLSQTDWETVCARFEGWQNWRAAQPLTPLTELGAARIQTLLDDDTAARLRALIEQDLALADEVQAIAEVDRLVHYLRDLATLINNFVSFRNFYTGSDKAVFQAGTLYLDGRSCELCVKVEDVGKHATLANLSRVCLIYCECQRGSDKMTVAAAFTAGDADQLMVGRNGVFYDRKGQDWNATIVRILEHPISIRQAFWAPYKRAGKMIGEQIQKIATARSQAAEAKLVTGALEAGKSATAEPPKAPPPPFDVGKFAGVFAAIGLAIGALGTALASVVTGLLNLHWWQMPLVAVGALLAVSGPAMLLAWFKLKQRNLGPILDANGWAVNARAKINIPFGTALTGLAKLPEGTATLQLTDPFAEKKQRWPYYLASALLLAVVGWALWKLEIRLFP